MSKFAVDKKVFDILPDYCLGVVIAKEINNQDRNPMIIQKMREQAEQFGQKVAGINLKEYPGIVVYRDAFRKLGMNPNKFLCSIEALASRVQKGKSPLPNVNSIVDLGNTLSLKYMLPMGAHDIDRFDGDMMTIRFTTEEDHFQPMGSDKLEVMSDEELVYVSGNTVKTRRWIWRQSEDGKITGETRNVLFPIDGFEGVNDVQVRAAREELVEILYEQFHCRPIVGYLNKDNPQIEF